MFGVYRDRRDHFLAKRDTVEELQELASKNRWKMLLFAPDDHEPRARLVAERQSKALGGTVRGDA